MNKFLSLISAVTGVLAALLIAYLAFGHLSGKLAGEGSGQVITVFGFWASLLATGALLSGIISWLISKNGKTGILGGAKLGLILGTLSGLLVAAGLNFG
ncbi:MAG: hypothetical protein V3U82_04735 [Robiginitomaculum sp.]